MVLELAFSCAFDTQKAVWAWCSCYFEFADRLSAVQEKLLDVMQNEIGNKNILQNNERKSFAEWKRNTHFAGSGCPSEIQGIDVGSGGEVIP